MELLGLEPPGLEGEPGAVRNGPTGFRNLRGATIPYSIAALIPPHHTRILPTPIANPAANNILVSTTWTGDLCVVSANGSVQTITGTTLTFHARITARSAGPFPTRRLPSRESSPTTIL